MVVYVREQLKKLSGVKVAQKSLSFKILLFGSMLYEASAVSN